jgi:hypothetical protein
VIGWLLRRWRNRYPGPVLALSLALLIGLTGVLIWWVMRDLSRGQLVRPGIAVLVLALVSVRVIVSFKPRRR